MAPSGWWPLRRRLEIAHAHACSPVLEVGAGSGWLAIHLANWGHDVTSCDLDAGARAVFARNARAAGLDLEVVAADATSLPYADSSFASAFGFSVLEHVRELDAALSEFHRILREEGKLIVGVPNAFGTFSLIYDHNPRQLFKRTRRGDITKDHEHLHGPQWWRRRLSRYFTIEHVVKLEVLAPVLARIWGYERTTRWTRADCGIANALPAAVASDVIFVARRE